MFLKIEFHPHHMDQTFPLNMYLDQFAEMVIEFGQR